jgi:F-type H+-transporting ATPase subunit delta
MRQRTAARRYARALFDLAREQDRLEAVSKDLRDLEDLVERSPELAQLLSSPSVPRRQRMFLLQKLFEERLEPLSYRLILLLEAKDRLAILPDVARCFGELAREARGILPAAVVSATPLSAVQRARLKERLEARFGKQIDMTVSADASLIGGFRVQAGDEVLDASLSTQLELVRQSMARG